MAKPAFDLVVLSIGYKRFAVPRAAALQFMELCAGTDIYVMDTHWRKGAEQEDHAWLMSAVEMPTVALLGPAQFHQALENRRVYTEEQDAEKRRREEAV